MKVLTLLGSSLVVSGLLFGSAARADQMRCMLTVYKAKDMIGAAGGTSSALDTVKEVQITIDKDGEADEEFTVNGEKVQVMLGRYEHTDLYSSTVVLTTPTADIPARGGRFVAMVSDFLYNAGPADDDSGFGPRGGKGLIAYEYLNRQSGSFGLSHKVVTALRAEGKWGQYPFISPQISIQNVSDVTPFIEEQVKAKKMKEEDVIGVGTMFNCVRKP